MFLTLTLSEACVPHRASSPHEVMSDPYYEPPPPLILCPYKVQVTSAGDATSLVLAQPLSLCEPATEQLERERERVRENTKR